jgi:alkylation response protein AidB-like acyl-CoA dehydrogenase
VTVVANAPSPVAADRPWHAVLEAGWPAATALPRLPEGADPTERILAFRRSAFGALTVPVELGGGGGGLLEAAAVQRALGATDPSIAVALNMHTLSVGLMAEHWRRRRDTSWMLLEALATGGGLVASAFAEPGGSANILRSNSIAVRTPSGFRVSGTKFPCSLATTSELICFSAEVEGEDRTIVGLCATASGGIEVTAAWPSIGMAASDTARVELRDVEVDRRLVFHEAPAGTVDDIVVGGIVWFAVLIAATYQGVLEGLLDLADREPHRSVPVASRELALAHAAADLLALGLAGQGLARAWSEERVVGDAALVAAAGLRLLMSATVDRVLATVRPVLGAAAYTAGTPASRLVLDALAAHHHPLAIPLCESLLAAAGAGRPLSLDGTS